ncbi:MAG: ABC transporter ATP-binding protein [Deltaproteobacteria bacterium]|nr:ABC transporter ATP-binding protein [Deltaproteobacteria bacterium]
MLVLENIQKSFTHNGNIIDVLRGIDLSVKQGDTLALLGTSGVGKSTLLNVMGTLEPPTTGRVLFEGRVVSGLTEASLCRLRNRDIGFVFQFHHLLPEFDAVENTIMPALIARHSRKEALRKAEGILTKVGLGRRMKHRIGELSGGEQQRVAIARALIMKPRLLLADEPTGNLDRVTGEEIVDLLLWLNREEGLAMVVATHNERLADRLARRMEIVDGRIQSQE